MLEYALYLLSRRQPGFESPWGRQFRAGPGDMVYTCSGASVRRRHYVQGGFCGVLRRAQQTKAQVNVTFPDLLTMPGEVSDEVKDDTD